MDKGPLSKHRFQVWNKNQHPYKHTLSEFAYSNETMPGVNNPQEAMDWLIAVLYPLSQTAVNTPADLPQGGNVLAVDTVTDTFTAAAHGYKDTDMVRIASTGTLPAPLMLNQTYFIKNDSANTFQLALTSDPLAAVIDITTAGTGVITVENVSASYRVVTDDGDGKAAAYRWQQLPSDVAPQWYKVYDMDWSQDSILAAFQDITQDLYVYQKGKQDLDINGDPLIGVDAGQNVYGSSQSGENLNLYANFIDPDTGFIQFGSQVAPKVHNVINLGETARRFVNLYLSGALTVGSTVYADGNIDAAGGVVDFNDNDITTTGDIAANDAQLTTATIGNLSFAANGITSDTNIISMLNQVLQDLIELISAKVTVTDGTETLELTVGALFASYTSSTGIHDFSNEDVQGIDELTANEINLTIANIGNFVISANDITNPNPVTVTAPSVAVTGSLSAASVAATGASTGATGQFGNYTFDATDVSTVAVNSDLNLNPNGTGHVVVKKLLKPFVDATLSLGEAALRFTNLFLSGGVSDGTDTISIAQLLSFRNSNTGANNGDVLFYDTATQRWLPSAPDAEIDHGTLSGLGDDDHTQYLLNAGRAGGQSAFGGTASGDNLTLQGNSAAATNGDVVTGSHFRPNTDNTLDLGTGANRFNDLYAGGQSIGIRLENTATDNNYGVASVGRQYLETDNTQPYVDGGTFAKYAMHTDTVTNSTLTGAAQTVPFTLTNIVKLTNTGLTSISNIAIQADIQGNRYKLLLNDTTNAITLTNGANIITGTGSDFNMANATAALLFYDGAAWRLVSGSGSGSGAGGIEYITNGTGEGGTTGWSTYNDGASSRPVDGTGGVVTGVTFAVTPTNPLRGNNSFLLTKDAANRQGMGVSYDFTIDRQDQGKVLTITKEYIINSGTFVAGTPTTDSDVIIYIYDVTNSRLIEPSNIKMLSNSSTLSDRYQADFQTATDSRNYRLITHIASTSTAAYAIKFEASVKPNSYIYGTPVTDWRAYTPTFTGMGTVTAIDAYWRRVGDTIELDVRAATGTIPGGVENRVSLPNGYVTKTTPFTNIACGAYFRGDITTSHGGAVLKVSGAGYVCFSDSGTFSNANVAALTPTTAVAGSGTGFSFFARIPTAGLSSSVQMSDSADTRVVAARYYETTAKSVTTTQPMNFSIKDYDTHSAVTVSPTAWRFTAPVPGKYRISGVFNAAATFSILLYKNGSVFSQITSVTTNVVIPGSDSVDLNSGDYIELRTNTTVTTIAGQQANTFISIERISGPSAIAATELIAASYWQSASANVNANTPFNFDSKDFDTHNAVSTGAGTWKFTAPTAGKYAVGGVIASNAQGQIRVFKNGSAYKNVGYDAAADDSSYYGLIDLIAGDFIDIRNSATSSSQSTGTQANSGMTININRVGF